MDKKKKKWKKSPQELVDVFYEMMNQFPDAELRKMFGYPCAFLNGNMFVGLHEGNLVVRLGSEDRQEALDKNLGDIFAPMQGRVMKEYVALSQEIIHSRKQLKGFISKSLDFVKALPVKTRS